MPVHPSRKWAQGVLLPLLSAFRFSEPQGKGMPVIRSGKQGKAAMYAGTKSLTGLKAIFCD